MILSRDLRGLTVTLALRSFALGLVNVFVPLLMIKQHATLWNICLFYVIYSLCKMAVNYPSIVLIERLNPAFGLNAALVASAAYLILLNVYVGGGAWAVWAAPAALALMNAFLWNSQHVHIARALDGVRRGRDMAALNVVVQAATIAAPPIGAAIVVLWGQQALLYAALAVVLVAVAPARAARNLPQRNVPSVTTPIPLPRRDLAANFAFNVGALSHFVVWPVYLAIVFTDFAAIGAVSAIGEVLGLLLLFVAGRRGDKGGTRRVLTEGTVAVAATHLLRLLALNPITITLTGGFARAALDHQKVPWVSTYYTHAKHYGARYVWRMELMGDIAYLCVWTALLAGALTIDSPRVFFAVAFVGAAVVSLGCLAITPVTTAKRFEPEATASAR